MQRLTWHALLAAAALVASTSGRAQAPQIQAPQPTVREIATIPISVGESVDGRTVDWALRMPNGRVVIYADDARIFAYDLVSKRTTMVTSENNGSLSMSRAGDRLAYERDSEDGKSTFVWSIPINPATGSAAGSAQRVTIEPGDGPVLSPDGTLIAFHVRTDGDNDLALVAATGGTVRILAKYKWLTEWFWSDDGKSIFAFQGVGPAQSIDRVPAAGGPSEKLMSYPGRGGGLVDGQIAFSRPGALPDGRVAYLATSGAQGEFTIPLRCPADPTFPRCSVRGDVNAAQSLLWSVTSRSTARVLNLADSSVRDLFPQAAVSRAPLWSPDGRRVVLQDLAGDQFGITIMNVDGSQRRRYPVSDVRGRHMRWSPDGQMLAYQAPGIRTISVLDVATGSTRLVSSAPPNRWIQDFIWRPDSHSIVLVKSAPSGDPKTAVYEAQLDGTERELYDFGPTLPRSGPGGFISDQKLLIGRFEEQHLVSLADGKLQRIPGTERRIGFPGVSRDGQRLFWLIANTDGSITSGQVMEVGGNSVRTLSLPFAVDREWPYVPFHPDGRHVALVGKTPGESAFKIFLMSLDGDAPRVLTPLSGRVDNMRISPDGKTLAYDLESTPTSTIYELDVSPILKTIVKR